jgi:hypothetical protein
LAALEVKPNPELEQGADLLRQLPPLAFPQQVVGVLGQVNSDGGATDDGANPPTRLLISRAKVAAVERDDGPPTGSFVSTVDLRCVSPPGSMTFLAHLGRVLALRDWS